MLHACDDGHLLHATTTIRPRAGDLKRASYDLQMGTAHQTHQIRHTQWIRAMRTHGRSIRRQAYRKIAQEIIYWYLERNANAISLMSASHALKSR